MKFRKYIFLVFLFYSYIPVFAQVDTAWVRRYNGPGNGVDVAHALVVDKDGNVYVTGQSGVTTSDYLTIKYYPNGDTVWVRRYIGPGGFGDYAYSIAVDSSGNVYVTGESNGIGTSQDFATIKYYPNGDTAWVRRYNGPGNDNEEEPSLAIDNSGNVYITGRSADVGSVYDYATIKYDASGNEVWIRRYNGPGDSDDQTNDIAVDSFGNVYVTGRSFSGITYDYATIKYSPAGDTLWVRRYNGPGNGHDEANALAVDGSGNVYVTGYSPGSGTGPDYATIKYSPSGDTVWVRRYNGPFNHYDWAHALAVDGSGNLYVTGQSNGGGTGDDYATIKYSSAGDTLWVRRYNGPGNGEDRAFALALDGSGNVYVTGESYGGSGTGYDYATIKYAQFTCTAKPGDANADGNILLPDIITIINFLFRSAPAPTPLCRGDANGNGTVLLPDIIYLINFI
ncbi:MAG TPA: SBBP repeat-containing protein, partial [candidate division Zixibacteria bacterium]|nr:SBBP repeat-containing protein [candidate division Zixibacteria bacterium]